MSGNAQADPPHQIRHPALPVTRDAAALPSTVVSEGEGGHPGVCAAPMGGEEDDAAAAIGARIQSLIDESGFASQAAFARAIGVGTDTINHWVNGRRRPRRSSLSDVARVFGLPPAAVFAYVERGRPLPRPLGDIAIEPTDDEGLAEEPAPASSLRVDGPLTSDRDPRSAVTTAATAPSPAGARPSASIPWDAGFDAEHAVRVQALRSARASRHPEAQIPLINRVAAGGPFDADDLDDALGPDGLAHPVDYISRGEVCDDPVFAFTVTGESMMPFFQHGDVCICSGARAVRSGDDCFVRFTSERNDECTFKRVHFAPADATRAHADDEGGERAGLIILQPLNPQHATLVVPREHIAQLWPVIELRRRIGSVLR